MQGCTSSRLLAHGRNRAGLRSVGAGNSLMRRGFASGTWGGRSGSASPGKVLLVTTTVSAGATALFGFPRHRRASALEGENDDEGYQRLALLRNDDNEDVADDAIVFEGEGEEDVDEGKEQDDDDEEELLPASRLHGVRLAKKSTSPEEEARLKETEARIKERIRSWPQFEATCADDEEDGPIKVTLRHPPWMERGEPGDTSRFTIGGASPRGQEDLVVDMIAMLATTTDVTRRRDLYEFHRGIRDEIGKQARVVKPRMRWVVGGRPALGFTTAFTGWGKTLVSTYVVTPYRGKGYVLVFNSVHDAETPLPQCLRRHQEETDESFDYVLRSVNFRPSS